MFFFYDNIKNTFQIYLGLDLPGCGLSDPELEPPDEGLRDLLLLGAGLPPEPLLPDEPDLALLDPLTENSPIKQNTE